MKTQTSSAGVPPRGGGIAVAAPAADPKRPPQCTVHTNYNPVSTPRIPRKCTACLAVWKWWKRGKR